MLGSVMEINTLKATIEVNSTGYILYTGFMVANEIPKYCRVPSFDKEKDGFQIATDLVNNELDEWQRPLLEKKVSAIIDLYSRTDQDNVMPNAILLGIDSKAIDPSTNANPAVCEFIPLGQDVVKLKLETKDGAKPLVILDGQHRVAGMSKSLQKGQVVPFVLCSDGFDLPKLAEIFTHVTTEATEMKSLHKAWMQYNFNLGPFSTWHQKKSGLAAVRLCTEEGVLYKEIRFNDDRDVSHMNEIGGFNQGKFNFSGWARIINQYYYSQFATESSAPDVIKLVNSINRIISAINECTSNVSTSKFFTTSKITKYHSTLCESFMQEFLIYIQTDNSLLDKTKEDWVTFLKQPLREWDKAAWNLPYLTTLGQNANDLQISRRVADSCFRAMFNDLSKLGAKRMHQYLQGEGGHFNLHAYAIKGNGKPDLSTEKIWEVKSDDTVNISEDGTTRVFVRISKGTDNWDIKRPRDGDVTGTKIVDGIMVKSPKFNIVNEYPGLGEKKFKIPRHSYHSSSQKTVYLTVNW